MQRFLYRWLLLVGVGHITLGLLLAFTAHTPLLQPYFDYLLASVSTQLPAPEFQTLLKTWCSYSALPWPAGARSSPC